MQFGMVLNTKKARLLQLLERAEAAEAEAARLRELLVRGFLQ